MDKVLQKRLVGTAVIVALAVIFIPMLLDGPKPPKEISMQIDIPAKPAYDIPNRLPPVADEALPVLHDATGITALDDQSVSSNAAGPVPGGAAEPSEAAIAAVPAITEAPPRTAPSVAAASTPQPVAEIKPLPAQPAKSEPSQIEEIAAMTKAPAAASGSQAAASRSSADVPGSGFVIQVGSFSNAKNAGDLKARLVSSGYPAFVDSTTLKSREIFRVKVGPKPSRKEANQLRLELIDEEKLEGIIVSYP